MSNNFLRGLIFLIIVNLSSTSSFAACVNSLYVKNNSDAIVRVKVAGKEVGKVWYPKTFCVTPGQSLELVQFGSGYSFPAVPNTIPNKPPTLKIGCTGNALGGNYDCRQIP